MAHEPRRATHARATEGPPRGPASFNSARFRLRRPPHGGRSRSGGDPGRTIAAAALFALGTLALPPALSSQSASLQSDPPPPPPANVAAVPQSPTQILVTWDDVSGWHDGDDEVEEYRVYRDGNLVATPSGTSHLDSGLQPGTTYRYEVSAVSEDDDKEGGKSHPVTATTPPAPDVTPPTAPTGLQANASAPDQVDLSWQAASDPESGIDSYRVYRNGSAVASPSGTSFSDTGLQPQTTYSYQVSAINGVGLEGGASGTVSVTTPSAGDQSPPTAPTGLQANASAPDQVDLSWQAASDPESGIDSYRVYRNGSAVASPSGTSFSDTGLQPQTTYSYQVSAINGVGLEGGASGTVSVTTPSAGDQSPPTSPSGLQASAVAADRVDLSWQAASDPESGVDSYRVYRNGIRLAVVFAPSYTDTDVEPSTAYAYWVTAVNGGGIEGGPSPTVSATTPAAVDIVPPAPPTGLRIVPRP